LREYLQEVTVVDGVQYHLTSDGWVVEDCIDKTLTHVIIRDEIDWKLIIGIDDSAFFMHPTIEYVEIPDTVEVIDKDAFWGCPNLKAVVCNGEYTCIEPAAFEGCLSLISFTAKGDILACKNAFKDCQKLQHLDCVISGVLPYAFANCSDLKQPLTFWDKIFHFHMNAFEGSGVSELRFLGGIPAIINDDDIDLAKFTWYGKSDSSITELAYLGINVQLTEP
jgi:hypothetical protein